MSKGLERPQGPVVSLVGTLCCTVTVLSPPTPWSRMVHPFSCFPWEHTGTSRPRWDRETDPLRLAGCEKVGCCFPTSPRHGHPCQHVDSSPIPGQKEQGRGAWCTWGAQAGQAFTVVRPCKAQLDGSSDAPSTTPDQRGHLQGACLDGCEGPIVLQAEASDLASPAPPDRPGCREKAGLPRVTVPAPLTCS